MTASAQKLIQKEFEGQALSLFQHPHVVGQVGPFLPRALLWLHPSPHFRISWTIPVLFPSVPALLDVILKCTRKYKPVLPH